mgnify:CR=1 FL=1
MVDGLKLYQPSSLKINNMTKKDFSLIPNSQLEAMFLRIATDKSMGQYLSYIKQGNTGLATAYASKKVYNLFMYLVDKTYIKG